MDTLKIVDLVNVSNLSAVRCADFAEAASVCLEIVGHNATQCILNVDGDHKDQFELIRPKVTQEMIWMILWKAELIV